MLFSELDLAGMLRSDDSAFGPETVRGEIPEALFWSTFCELLERIDPKPAPAEARSSDRSR